MAYRLKKIRYQSKPCHILLQNENGPCPLLAAANCLLLKGSISLPSNCVGAGVVTIDQLVNVLAEKILSNQTGSDHHIQEVLTIFPSLQFGMDVNPKFTAGPTGVEYTMHLNAFDLLHIELVHGWLLEPEAQEYDLISNQTYNQLINIVIEGNDASATLQQNPNAENHDELCTKATKGSIIRHFLDRTCHQLTQYGLTVLHEYLKDGQMVVFFRNNHFNTLTKHDGLLYLLITDFGYADVSSVVWEKLDVIDGDTEFVTEDFAAPPPIEQAPVGSAATGEQLVANNLQAQADYQLALQLSQQSSATFSALPRQRDPDMEAARQASLMELRASQVPVASPAAAVAPAPAPASAPPTPQASTGTIVNIPIQSAPSTPATPTSVSQNPNGQTPTVVMGVPSAPPSQEEQDMMFALQLQRQEEIERARRNGDEESRRLAVATHKKERKRQQRHVSRPAPPPTPLPTTPTGNSATSSNCIIS